MSIANAHRAKTLLVVGSPRPPLQDVLALLGCEVVLSGTGDDILTLAATLLPSLIIVDLPSSDGLEICRQLRARTEIPLVMLCDGGPDYRVAAFDAGADDIVTGPFDNAELVARIRSHLRRADRMASTFRADGLEVDFTRHRVRCEGREVHLTPTEFSLLRLLLAQAGHAVPHRVLISTLWGDSVGGLATLRVVVGRVRRKIEPSPAHPRFLLTGAGGYLFKG